MNVPLMFVTVGDAPREYAVRLDRIEAISDHHLVTVSGNTYELGVDQDREQLILDMAKLVNAARPR